MTYLLFYSTNTYHNDSYKRIISFLKSIGKCSSSRMDNNYSVLIEECDVTFIEIKNILSKILVKQNNENFYLCEIDITNSYNSFVGDKIINENLT